jgi:hypothetical protein
MRFPRLSPVSTSLAIIIALALMTLNDSSAVTPWSVRAAATQPSHSGLNVASTTRADFLSALATNSPPTGNQPGVCASLGVRCAQFGLRIDLRARAWSRPGGVQVAIRWPTDDNALDLYVYKRGAQVAKAEGFLAAMSESLLLRNAANGMYTVYVALDAANSLDASVPFDALARVQYDPPAGPVRPLLPDFAMRPQTTVTFETPVFPFFGDVADPGESCYRGEKSEAGAAVCMRFEQTFANIGEGAAELHFAIPKDPADTSHHVFARTYFSDGHDHFADSPAGTWEYHAAHHHYHYNNFVQSRLWAADSAGHRAGTSPVRVGRKVSFCMEDERIDDALWGKKGVRPRTYIAPDCLAPVAQDAHFDYIIQGLTPGWDDIYQWYLPGQYIEVSGIPDGNYILETTADPDNELAESVESNNCGTVLIHLTNTGTAQRHAAIIGAGPGCA